MSLVYEFLFLLFSHLLLAAEDGNGECPSSFNCGYLGNITFPFTKSERNDCGLLAIHNCEDPNSLKSKKIQFQNQGKWFQVVHLSQFPQDVNTTMFRCNRTLRVRPSTYMHNYTKCPDYDLYYNSFSTAHDGLTACTKVQVPIKDVPDAEDPFTFLTADIFTRVQISEECENCHYNQRGRCQLDSTHRFCCANGIPEKKGLSWKAKVSIGLGIGILGMVIIGLLLLLLLYKRKHATSGGHFQSSNSYSDSSLHSRRESGSVYFGAPVFSYEELKKATNNFDRTKELGDGGFGTVYYGKLPDGREVAVKRLYDHNYRSVEQFMNEVEILQRLRHKNLVSLYGCTSRHSRELLLVYEFISNGTVACHLHGGLAKPGLLPWSIRIKIAIETATALAYLHASDIVHRDVKTSNILLDSNYCVKVADFGLSRLFPELVTHVSTAPQGTPGYLDPEYYQCYQVTSKSDVYSFGVVLIELISSMPAVDINRSKDEINLSNLAIKKIQESAIGDLVDPSLGFDSDNEVKGMIVSVAGLVFQCLQRDRELRPSMEEVLDELRRIESGKDGVELLEEAEVHGVGISHGNVHSPPPASPEWDEVGLLKNMKLLASPNTVTDKWESKCTTPNVSG